MRAYRGTVFKAALLSTCLLTPVAAWAQSADQSATIVDEVVVTGRRAADRAALENKRRSDNQVDAVRADDVGRLPDQNVAEALRRLPGLSTSNDMGESRYLTVRGVSPDLLNVTLNGQTAPAPEPDGRQVKLDDIPSALIGSVTVVKTLTPDLDANAIAGQANIITLTAFDRNKTFGTLRAAYGYNELADDNPYEFDASYGTVFGQNRQFGMVLAANFSERFIAAENLQGGEKRIEVDGNEVPEEFTIRPYTTNRKRTGAVANFDWRPNDDAKMFLRFLYSKYEDAETRDNFSVELDEDDTIFSNTTPTSGDFADADANRRVRTRAENTDTFTSSIGGAWTFGESELNIEGTYSRANKRDPRRDEWEFKTGGLSGSYDLSEDLYIFRPEAAAYDASSYEADSVSYESREAVEDLYQARIDYRMPLNFGDGSSIKVGAKYINRKKTNDANAVTYDYEGDSLTLDQVAGRSIDSIYDGRYPFGPTVSQDLADAYFAANRADFEIDDEATIGDSLAADYDISETITAGYAMATLKFDRWTFIPGVRVEHTQGEFAAKSITDISTLDQGFDVFGKREYTDWFPGLNVRYDASDNLVLRGAITTAIGRPNYEDLAPYVIVNTGDEEVAVGNPDLQALESVNFDLAAEYYLGRSGVLSVSVFRKQIENPIFFSTQDLTDVTYAGIFLPDAEVTTPVNADKAEVNGIEFNVQSELDFLPIKGFSGGVNLTLVDSKASGVPGRDDEVPLLTQSDKVASAQISYERSGFSGRVAYTYRSAYLDTVGSEASEDLYVDDFNQWDARVAYKINDRASISLEASNLNDEPQRFFVGSRNRIAENERYGYSLRAGVQLTF